MSESVEKVYTVECEDVETMAMLTYLRDRAVVGEDFTESFDSVKKEYIEEADELQNHMGVTSTWVITLDEVEAMHKLLLKK